MLWIDSAEAADNWLAAHGAEPVYGIDCETEGIDPRKEPAAGPRGQIVCWTIAWGTEVALVWHTELTAWAFRTFLATAPVVGHNLYGFDRHMFRKAGIPLGNVVGDTLRLSQLVTPDDEAEHGLKALMKYRLGWKPVGDFNDLFTRQARTAPETFPEIRRTVRKVGEYSKVPTLVGGDHSRYSKAREAVPLSKIPLEHPELISVLYEYATLDAKATLALWHQFQLELKERPWTPPLALHAGVTPASLLVSGRRSAKQALKRAGSGLPTDKSAAPGMGYSSLVAASLLIE